MDLLESKYVGSSISRLDYKKITIVYFSGKQKVSKRKGGREEGTILWVMQLKHQRNGESCDYVLVMFSRELNLQV